MQLAFVIPILAVLMWKNPVCCYIVCIFMILFNVTLNMAMTWHYDLKIGYLDKGNFYLINLIAKPWTHL